MSWATRCNACGTVFRVAEDQLRVSDGYVRCGRCDAVFNARAQLFDLDAPPAASGFDDTVQIEAPALAPEEEPAQDPGTAELPAPQAATDRRVAAAPPDARQEPHLEPRREPHLDADWPPTAAEPAFEADPNPRLRELLGADAAAEPAPEAAAPMIWSSLEQRRPTTGPLRRGLAWLLVALLALGLPLQWAWAERELLRARWPGLDRLWMQTCPSCAPVQWRSLDGLSVTASSLQPTPQGQAYQLRLRIANRSTQVLAMPWIDLRLSDPDGRPLLRRSLSPVQLGSSLPNLAPETSAELGAVFELKGRVAGYEVALFHP